MQGKGKIAVITGASSSIGRAIASELSREGVKTILIARNTERLETTRKAVEETGGQAEIITGDLSTIESINTIIEAIKSKTEKVDILVNVAGIWHGDDEVYAGKDFGAFPQQVIIDTLMVGITAPTLLSHGVLSIMPSYGKIISISGTFEDGAKGWLPYYLSKRAIEDLTIGLAQELEDKNVQVNAISPSDTATDAYAKFFPEYLAESISPKEIAKQVAFLSSERANGITGKVFVMKKDHEPMEGYHS